MIFQLFRRTPQDESIARLYGMIVAQARMAAFYRDYGVPDTVNARFEMIVLHLVLFLRRLDRDGEAARSAGQAIFDMFCRDMDGNLRELGVGDLTVPRTMRKIGEAFYGRQQTYSSAIAEAAPGALASALGRIVFAIATDVAPGVNRLAAYVQRAVDGLDRMDTAAVRATDNVFPDPGRIPVHASPGLG